MLLSKDPKTEDVILELLSAGPMKSLALVQCVQRDRGLTKQAVYANLRKLVEAELLVLQKGVFSLNICWIHRMRDLLALSEHAYSSLDSQGHFLNLKEGERITYTFRDPLQADVFWNHALLLLAKIVPSEEPFLAYSPHCWFYLAEPERERGFRDQILASGRAYWVLVAGDTDLDASIAGEFSDERCEYHMLGRAALKKPNHYLWVMGDFLVDVWLDAATSQKIEDYYGANKRLDAEAFREVLRERRKSRFAISKNKVRAARFKKKWGRCFI